jgi:hypothetical protein
MLKNRISWIAIISIAFVTIERAASQEIVLAAEPAKKKFDAKIEELRSKLQTEIKAAVTDYTAKLDEQIKAATAKGDLDKVLTYRAEKEWLETDKLPMDTPASLKLVQTMRTAFETKKKTATASFEKGSKAAQTELFADLDLIVKEETKAGRLESALKVRELKQELEKTAIATTPAKPALPGPTTPKPAVKYLPGLLAQDYAKQSSQADKPVYVEPEMLTDPVGGLRVITSLNWKYDGKGNGVATGFLKIEKEGEYSFNSNNNWDRNAFYVDGKYLCKYQDGERTITKIELKPGYVPIVSVGSSVGNGAVRVKWIPPGETELVDIPPAVLFHIPPPKSPPPKTTPAPKK